ncbi:MAG: penicillin acylase family protein [Bacillota bacterium]
MLLIVMVLLLAAVIAVYFLSRRGLPRAQGMVSAEVGAAVEIYRDEYGVPHIIAQNMEDLCFAQGYVQAQDRLWQMDLSRRGVGGRLSEILGESFVDTDRFTLTVGFYRAARASYEQLNSGSQALLEAYARGVNAFIEDNRGKLSLEFVLLGYEPEPWKPVDSMAIGKYMAWYLGGNMNTELFLSALIEQVGEEMALELFPDYPETGPVIVPTVEQESAFKPDDVPALIRLSRLAELNGRAAYVPGLGSNNWVVSGAKTVGGGAMLANDMHLGMGLPSIWYANHLILEGEFNATGVMFPGIPGIIVGFNDHIAWGVTNTGPDVQDLYLIKLNPANPHQYLYQDQYVDAEVIVEELWVKDESEPRQVEVVITRHGPIISDVAELDQPISLCWTALSPTRELEAVQGFMKAQSWAEFSAALENFMAPAQNFVYADQEGNIAYRANGLIPIRRNGSGLLPVDGSTDEFEWEGYIPWDELPALYNPPEGIIVTANHRVVDDDYPYFISSEWAPPYRAMAILRELEGKERLSLEDMVRAQTSYFNTQAELLAPIMIDTLLLLSSLDEAEHKALLLLEEYSREPIDDAANAAPLIFHSLYLKLLEHIFADELGEDMFERLLHSRVVTNCFDRMLSSGESSWFNNVHTPQQEKRSDIIVSAFRETVLELKERLGPDPARWQWGNLHTITLTHNMGSVKLLERVFNRGPYTIGGSGNTPANMSYQPTEPFKVTHSAPWRYMVDLNGHTALDILSGGNSGHPFSEHYNDQTDKWLAGDYKEMIFQPSAVRALPVQFILTPR